MLSIWLSVIFVGIFGTDTSRIERQLQSLLHHDHGIDAAKLSSMELRELTRHGDGAPVVIDKLHADGAIAGELVEAKSGTTLRVVIYRADGTMKSLFEIPLRKHVLDKDDVEVLRTNLDDDIGDLERVAAHKADKQVAASAVVATPPPLPAPRPTPPTPAEPVRTAAIAPTQQATDSDAVSLSEIESMTATTTSDSADASPVKASSLRLGAAATIGVTQRSFSPGPATLPAYSSSAVGSVGFDAHVSPAARFALAVHMETTVDMSTSLQTGAAPTSMTRWEAAASYSFALGSASVEPLLGVGSRSFKIDSVDPTRSPDNDYNYVIAGARIAVPLGTSLSLIGNAALEPVFGGLEAAEMAFGDATRWAFDIGAGVEARPWSHVVLRATAGYQRFSWSWNMAGARGAGGASDSYPSGAVSLGAEY